MGAGHDLSARRVIGLDRNGRKKQRKHRQQNFSCHWASSVTTVGAGRAKSEEKSPPPQSL